MIAFISSFQGAALYTVLCGALFFFNYKKSFHKHLSGLIFFEAFISLILSEILLFSIEKGLLHSYLWYLVNSIYIFCFILILSKFITLNFIRLSKRIKLILISNILLLSIQLLKLVDTSLGEKILSEVYLYISLFNVFLNLCVLSLPLFGFLMVKVISNFDIIRNNTLLKKMSIIAMFDHFSYRWRCGL